MQLDNSSAIRRKYYYAMYEWNVWGRCSCFGHATRCKPKSIHEVPNMEKVRHLLQRSLSAGFTCHSTFLECRTLFISKVLGLFGRDGPLMCL